MYCTGNSQELLQLTDCGTNSLMSKTYKSLFYSPIVTIIIRNSLTTLIILISTQHAYQGNNVSLKLHKKLSALRETPTTPMRQHMNEHTHIHALILTIKF